jgi:formylglycine-generating enzyme required for sulfatase activity
MRTVFSTTIRLGLAMCITVASAGAAQGSEVVTVFVGDAGNASDVGGLGAVAYDYRIGQFEVTAGQYVAFLNAVAGVDEHGLYNPLMWSHANGCKIQRTGSSGSYSYSVAGDRANRPVTQVSWGDAARYANWLHNGQRAGPQNASTTEDGAYALKGAMGVSELMAVSRTPTATWGIPTENEWYKAAYYSEADAAYFDYPTSTDATPGRLIADPDPGNNANYYVLAEGPLIGDPYYRTVAGEFENSASPSNTFDQGGNVWEWNEAVVNSTARGVRGGSYDNTSDLMLSSFRGEWNPTYESPALGFRVVAFTPVPEPATLALLGLGGLLILRRRRRSGTRRGNSEQDSVTACSPCRRRCDRADNAGRCEPLMAA